MTIIDLGLLILRLAVGLTFAAHGAQKAFGWWGGPGPERWTKAVFGMGFQPAELFSVASIGAELVAGVALAIGLLTPLAATVLVAQSVVIIVQAHLPRGFFSTQGGFEFPFVLGAAVIAIGLIGPGLISADNLVGLGFEVQARVILVVLGLLGGGLAVAVVRAGRGAERAAPRRAR